MSIKGMGSRAIIGEFFKALSVESGLTWQGKIAMEFQSDQSSEEYKWLGMAPAMVEFIGGRKVKGLRENGVVIPNRKYESTIEVDSADFQRDKTGQTRIRIRDLGARTITNWNSLISTLILAGKTSACYDGQFFFDTDHVEGENTTNQSNKINVDISELPAQVHGSVTAPSTEEMSLAIEKAISQIFSFIDDQNEPMNELVRSFIVMSGTGLSGPISAAVTTKNFSNGGDNQLISKPYSIEPVANVRLNTWTDQLVVFAANSTVAAFIKQNEVDVKLMMKGEGSEYDFDNDKQQFGTYARRGADYGFWQQAVHVTLT